MCGWVCRRARAASPISTVPSSSMPTQDGVRFLPRALGMMEAFPSRQTATRLLVVPRSIPMIMSDIRFRLVAVFFDPGAPCGGFALTHQHVEACRRIDVLEVAQGDRQQAAG